MLSTTSVTARRWVKGLAVVAALALASGDAFARAGGGKSSGSRGSFSRSAPPVTDTAPRTAQPLPGASQASPSMPGAAAAATTRAAGPSRFGGLMGGLAMGFLGAGLFGLLSGSGFFGGLGSLMGLLGLALQIALVVLVVRLALNYFRNRQQPAAAAANAAGHARQAAPAWAPPAGAASAQPVTQPLKLIEGDFNSFERMLGEVQACYSRDDRNGLMQRATPQMCDVFFADLDALARDGLTNRISGVKLLQGDLSEAWREGSSDYATVAMRFALSDVKVDKASGRVVEGDPAHPQEVTEVWTFVRNAGDSPEAWKLSAIQQA